MGKCVFEDERFGIDFWQVLEQGRNLRFSLHLKSGTVRDTPGFSAQVDLGAQAAAVFEHLAKEGVAEALPDADAAVTVTWAGTEVHVQRRGTWLLAHSEDTVAGPGVAVEPGHDLSIHVDGPLLLESLPAEGGDVLAGEPWWLRRLLIDSRTTFDLVTDGFSIESNLGAPWKALRPVDLQVLNQLSTTTIEVMAVGVDGPALWEEIGRPASELWSRTHGPVPRQPLQELGCDLPLETMIRGISGTWAFAITPSAPMPGYAVIVPRSESTDAVVSALVAKINGTVPAEGAALPLPLPIPLPILLNLARNRTHWLLTTDAMLTPTWLADGGASWLASPLGTLATRTAGNDAPAVSVTDTAAQIRMVLPYLGMMTSQISILAPAEKQALTVLVSRLATLAKPSWGVLRPVGGHLQASSRGLTTSNGAIAVAAVVAGIALPNLMQSRVTANEAAAATTLKSCFFPAQVQFQSGAYIDTDKDGRGEYAPEIALLAGKTTATMTRSLSLIAPDFAAQQPVLRNGYRYALYTFGDTEQNFVAYAWPDRRENGRKAFALSITGVVYERPWTAADQPLTTYSLWSGSEVEFGSVEPAAPWKPFTVHRKSDHAENDRRKADGAKDDRSPRKQSGNRIRQLILGAMVFANDNDQKMPKDFAELIDTTGGDLSAKSLNHPAHPERNDAYLYVRAWTGAKSSQPLIVEDPAVWNGEGCWVGYCDGHLGWLNRAAAATVWAHAKTLAGSPKAQGDGIEAQDWAPVQPLLEQQPK